MTVRAWIAGLACGLALVAGPVVPAWAACDKTVDEFPATEIDVEGLPDGVVLPAFGRVESAWLAKPTTRYSHGVIGDAVEASAARVLMKDGRRLTFELPEDSVFEDRYLRPVQLDSDDDPEFLVVRSYLKKGAAVAVLKIYGKELRILAESKPIGQPNRWLNPIGVGDVDGDGQVEIAVILTPHIGGTLATYELRKVLQFGEIREEKQRWGFSNHALGTRMMEMAQLADVDRDGIMEVIVPDSFRKSLHIVTVQGEADPVSRQILRTGGKEITGPVRLDKNRYGRAVGVCAKLSNGKWKRWPFPPSFQ